MVDIQDLLNSFYKIDKGLEIIFTTEDTLLGNHYYERMSLTLFR